MLHRTCWVTLYIVVEDIEQLEIWKGVRLLHELKVLCSARHKSRVGSFRLLLCFANNWFLMVSSIICTAQNSPLPPHLWQFKECWSFEMFRLSLPQSVCLRRGLSWFFFVCVRQLEGFKRPLLCKLFCAWICSDQFVEMGFLNVKITFSSSRVLYRCTSWSGWSQD